MKRTTMGLATVCIVIVATGCAAAKTRSYAGTKDIVGTSGKIKISASLSVDSALNGNVVDATGRHLCFGITPDSNARFVVWTASSKKACMVEDSENWTEASMYVKGVGLKEYKYRESTDRTGIKSARLLIDSTQVGTYEVDERTIAGEFVLKELCSGPLSNACDLIIQGDKIEITLKK